ncbi:hypothetical protein Kpol_1028p100 [Vanderwaltozyma polyspora DSM 70294]|uniref:Ubiquitin carboxyl-terminal hydrolase n=1 Tax=Vanderwaltozyma polyspora (strain ATCC 22028 / DSM 70294 / BCRC 21397 / CBS 2163 / NBRC 10782 / NRRL Y-8283 / UCD 57-17) TaxID=436907 RepID=A7TG67_VANPO|nr:uncharacterized protein Kpol_1028p100 [Vanderwaltozyma polyspora DSM 70294]EDO18824.1 hypothetical protein Kpol_1028p100 [Vanderwaltozyma polyspora DSM 70294]
MNDIKSVVPLESNPEVFTNFAYDLGLNRSFAFIDLYSLTDPELLAFVPTPVRAIVLLFPINDFFEKNKGDTSNSQGDEIKPIWFQQTVRNACGLYAILHSLSNNKPLLQGDSELSKYLEDNRKVDGQYNDDKTDNFVVQLSDKYSTNFTAGDTEAPSSEENVNLHFITFIEKDGKIYELDGRKVGANCLGDSVASSIDGNLLNEKVIVDRVNWYMGNADEASRLQFSLLALAPSLD